MKLVIDTDNQTLVIEDKGQRASVDLYSKSAFEIISQQWLKVGWSQKYPYVFAGWARSFKS
jgi:hypothetical protein